MKKLVVMVAALALVATSAMTAAAADWNFYGNARVETFMVDTETITDANNSLKTDSTTLNHKLFATSRIGAVAKVNDELTGGFEVGMNSGAFNRSPAGLLDEGKYAVSNQDSVYLRHIWGEWNFGAGSLLVGRNWAPLNYFYSNQVFGDDGLTSYGGVYTGRRDMIQLKFGGFKVALVEPKAPDSLQFAVDYPEYGIEYRLPQIQANYNMVLDNFSFNLGAGWNQFEIEPKPGTVASGDDVTSYILSAGAKVTFGPVFLSGSFYTGENGAALGMGNWAEFNDDTGAIVDTDSMGYTLVAGYTLNDMFSFELGYGYKEFEKLNAANALVDDENTAYYAQSTITLTPGFFIVPEIGMIDQEEAGQNEILYYGLKWQINF